MEDWALWLGVVGVASFVAIQLSLLTTALEVAEMSSRGPYSNVPNVFTATNCAIGSIYAFCIRSPPLLLANFCGLIICFYCIMIFQANNSYGEGPVALDQTLWIFVGPTLLVMITLLLAVFDKTALVGFAMAACSVGMMGSPLSTTLQVIKSRSSASMPIRTSAMMLINGLIWATYGFLLGDVFVLAPNIGGSLLAIVQVGLWMRFELCRQVTKMSDYFFVGSFSDIDEDDEATTIRVDDDTIFSNSIGPYLVPLRPPEPLQYPNDGKTHPPHGETTDLLSPQSDISDLTWGTHRSRFERVLSALSPLSPSRKKKLAPTQYPFYGATG